MTADAQPETTVLLQIDRDIADAVLEKDGNLARRAPSLRGTELGGTVGMILLVAHASADATTLILARHNIGAFAQRVWDFLHGRAPRDPVAQVQLNISADGQEMKIDLQSDSPEKLAHQLNTLATLLLDQ